jgi:RHS repeat-associated protein
MTTKTRKTYIGKERDDESYLGDFGVRKYDYAAGRFTSPDVLWEKYMTWSPYHYCGNNPHDANGNILEWGSDKMSFSGTPSYNSNGEYSQVTMELFLGNIAAKENRGGQTAIQYMISVFGHESDHSTNQGVIDMIRYNQNKNIESIEKPAINLQIQILKEMK